MKFEEYHIANSIKKSLKELGFRHPTDIQYKAIPPILKGEDVLAIAQTGTGKTAAFAIPVIHMLHQRKKEGWPRAVNCLVMVPTHELAIQITEVFQKIAQYTEVKTLALYGGVEQIPQIEELNAGADIVIATPGRMFDLASQGHLNLNLVEVLILDEADHMLDLGFYNDISDLIKRLPKSRQTLFFSATINEHIKDLAYSIVKNAIRIQVSPKDPVSKNIDHAVAYIDMDDKRFFLERMIRAHTENKILVFVRTKVRAERVAAAMERAGISTETLHGDKDQHLRLEVMNRFKAGEIKVLIATDVSARGIDIPNVDYVVNYDLPEKAENYVHRVGRTGRGIHKGQAISFCSPEEKEVLDEIENFLDRPIQVMEIDKKEYIATLDFTNVVDDNWRELLADAEKDEAIWKAKKRVKRRR